MKSIHSKINNIIGQLSGIKRMIDKKKDCLEVLTQLKAVKSAVAGIMENVAEESFDKCIKDLSEKDRQQLLQIKRQLIKS